MHSAENIAESRDSVSQENVRLRAGPRHRSQQASRHRGQGCCSRVPGLGCLCQLGLQAMPVTAETLRQGRDAPHRDLQDPVRRHRGSRGQGPPASCACSFSYLLSANVHVPHGDPSIRGTGDQLPRELKVTQGLHPVAANDTQRSLVSMWKTRMLSAPRRGSLPVLEPAAGISSLATGDVLRLLA